MQVKNSETQRNIWRILEREFFSYRAIVPLISRQSPTIKRLTVGCR